MQKNMLEWYLVCAHAHASATAMVCTACRPHSAAGRQAASCWTAESCLSPDVTFPSRITGLATRLAALRLRSRNDLLLHLYASRRIANNKYEQCRRAPSRTVVTMQDLHRDPISEKGAEAVR